MSQYGSENCIFSVYTFGEYLIPVLSKLNSKYAHRQKLVSLHFMFVIDQALHYLCYLYQNPHLYKHALPIWAHTTCIVTFSHLSTPTLFISIMIMHSTFTTIIRNYFSLLYCITTVISTQLKLQGMFLSMPYEFIMHHDILIMNMMLQ